MLTHSVLDRHTGKPWAQLYSLCCDPFDECLCFSNDLLEAYVQFKGNWLSGVAHGTEAVLNTGRSHAGNQFHRVRSWVIPHLQEIISTLTVSEETVKGLNNYRSNHEHLKSRFSFERRKMAQRDMLKTYSKVRDEGPLLHRLVVCRLTSH